MSTTSQQTSVKTVNRTFWTAAIFYMMVAFEFFYMASPFAIYFYSVYKPGLNFLNQFPSVSWIVGFFLPHIVVETSSTFLNLHNQVGAVMAIIGWLCFCVAAAQVYYNKLKRKGAVTGGIYNFIRHPQYASFALCSFGLLLLWPRFIVLFMFITMLFAYYFLAKAEERECEEKFGPSYVEYKKRTHMFFPWSLPFADKLPGLPKSRVAKALALLALYCLAIILSLAVARELQYHTLDSLYTLYTKDSVYIGVSKTTPATMEKLVAMAMGDNHVREKLEKAKTSTRTRFLNYILPATWYVSEIPMNPVGKDGGNHFISQPEKGDTHLYKIIFTTAHLRTGQEVQGKKMLLHMVTRTPIVEVWLDVSKNQVIAIKEPPAKVMYENILVPIY